jgi:hypothetical protein
MNPRMDIVKKHRRHPSQQLPFLECHKVGWHPIHVAALNGLSLLVKDLIDAGIPYDLPTQTREPKTAWSIALSNNHFFVLDALIEKGYPFEKALENSVTANPFYFEKLLTRHCENRNLWMRALYRIGGWEVVPDEKERTLNAIQFPKRYSSAHAYVQGNWAHVSPLLLNASQLDFLSQHLKVSELDELIEDMIMFSGCIADERQVKNFYDELQKFLLLEDDEEDIHTRMDEIWNNFDEDMQQNEFNGIEPIVYLSMYRMIKYHYNSAYLVDFVDTNFEESGRQFLEWMAQSGDLGAFDYCLTRHVSELKVENVLPLEATQSLCRGMVGRQVVSPVMANKLFALFSDPFEVPRLLRQDESKAEVSYSLMKKSISNETLFFFLLDKFHVDEQTEILKRFIADILVSEMGLSGIYRCLGRLEFHKADIQDQVMQLFHDQERFFHVPHQLLAKLFDYFPNLRDDFTKWAVTRGPALINQWVAQSNFSEAKKLIQLLLLLFKSDPERSQFFETMIKFLQENNRAAGLRNDFVTTLRKTWDDILMLANTQAEYYNDAVQYESVFRVASRVRDMQRIAEVSRRGMFFGRDRSIFVTGMPIVSQNDTLACVVQDNHPRVRPSNEEVLTAMKKPNLEYHGELRFWQNLLVTKVVRQSLTKRARIC